jgi:hypothetical protein
MPDLPLKKGSLRRIYAVSFDYQQMTLSLIFFRIETRTWNLVIQSLLGRSLYFKWFVLLNYFPSSLVEKLNRTSRKLQAQPPIKVGRPPPNLGHRRPNHSASYLKHYHPQPYQPVKQDDLLSSLRLHLLRSHPHLLLPPTLAPSPGWGSSMLAWRILSSNVAC